MVSGETVARHFGAPSEVIDEEAKMYRIGLYRFLVLDIPLHTLYPSCKFPDKIGGVSCFSEKGVTVIARQRNEIERHVWTR